MNECDICGQNTPPATRDKQSRTLCEFDRSIEHYASGTGNGRHEHTFGHLPMYLMPDPAATHWGELNVKPDPSGRGGFVQVWGKVNKQRDHGNDVDLDEEFDRYIKDYVSAI